MIRCKCRVDSITKVACDLKGVLVDITSVICESFGEYTPLLIRTL